jgi:hypothetical protein
MVLPRSRPSPRGDVMNGRTTVVAVTILMAFAAQAEAQTGVPVAALPLVQERVTFVDPQEGAFFAQVPRGWKTQGGTVRRNALQYRNWLSTTSPDGATILAINDPNEWAYVIPSQMLATAGFREGSIYSGGGGTVYTVAPYQNGAQFSAAWGHQKLASMCSNVRVAGTRERPELTNQINAYARASGLNHDTGDASFTCTDPHGQPMSAYVLTSVLSISGQFGAIWYAEAIIGMLAPTPVAGVAAGELARMVTSVQVNPQWAARQTQTNVDVSRIMTQTNHAISDSIMQTWESKGAIMDRLMSQDSRARLGIEIYEDPATGTKYTVANQHQYNWVNAQGTVVGTDTDTAPNGFARLRLVPPGQ